MDADLGKRPLVFAVVVGIEQNSLVDGGVQPAVRLDFALQLPRRPTGIPERQERLMRSPALGDGAQYLQSRGEGDSVVHRQRRVIEEEVRGMQHEAAARLHWPATMDPEL